MSPITQLSAVDVARQTGSPARVYVCVNCEALANKGIPIHLKPPWEYLATALLIPRNIYKTSN
jgi:hypothetical protein